MIDEDIKITHQDVRGAIHLVQNPSEPKDSEKYSTVFLFGTENQEGINAVISYKDKEVLTVCSSGDQYLAAMYYGAKKVDLYDINRLTKPVTYLKIASMMDLSYEDFMHFLIPLENQCLNSSFWDLNTLKRLIPTMPVVTAYFWDQVMHACKKHSYGNFINLFHESSEKSNVLRGMPFYSNEEEYYKLQALLRKKEYPKFIEADILHLREVVHDQYDIAYLSNILESLVCLELRAYEFANQSIENCLEEKYIFAILKEVMPVIKRSGTILMSYRPNKSIENSTDLLFNNAYFEIAEIPSKYMPKRQELRNTNKDLVLTYKPQDKGNILDLLN